MFMAQLEAVIAGEEPVSHCVRSQLDFWIYNKAVEVLAALRCHRVAIMDELPEELGNLVRAEVIRVHALRRQAPRPKVQAEPVRATPNPDWNDWI